ncbi:interleukin-17A-like [Nerophis lumbriciformis]|uniref:interleukin-17A-like n=1 Tax=Nerophis lumbriciformis TaxID=546530 RepID=UPI002AE04887|nr:interleukin-17A-like [Nerophis lumbriciformis]
MFLVLGVVLRLGLAVGLHGRADRRTPDRTTVRLLLDPLLRHMTSAHQDHLANVSLSPWTYRESNMAWRLPRVLSNARCLTSGCLGQPGGIEDATLQVRPIEYQVLVLHRITRQKKNKKKKNLSKKKKNKYEFRLGTEMITVGCTCVRNT